MWCISIRKGGLDRVGVAQGTEGRGPDGKEGPLRGRVPCDFAEKDVPACEGVSVSLWGISGGR
jgi:hypothetical protein